MHMQTFMDRCLYSLGTTQLPLRLYFLMSMPLVHGVVRMAYAGKACLREANLIVVFVF